MLIIGAFCKVIAQRLRIREKPTAKEVRARFTIDFDSLSEEDYYNYIGFTKPETMTLHNLLNIPQFFYLNEHTTHEFKVSGVHSFLYFLSRLHSPSHRLTLDMDFWQYDFTVLSKIFNVVVTFVDSNHSHRLNQIHRVVSKFPMFNYCIKKKLQHLYPNIPLPQDSTRCAMFADVCRFEICRPQGGLIVQKAFYSKHKKIHNHGALGIFGPDGMFYHWWDEPVGRHNDKLFMSDSEVNWIMHTGQINEIIKYWIYTDKGFNNDDYIRCAAHGPGFVTPEQHADNAVMGRGRVSEEWGFGKLKARCPFVNSKKLPIQCVDVGKYVRVATLLTNAHTCFHQSITGLYFDCYAPTIHEYFGDY